MAKTLTLLDPSDTTVRKCGDCVGCCLAPSMRVEPYKELGSQCSEVRNGRKKGCGVYETRPDGCRAYECHWLKNNFLERKHRPDKIGIIFDDGETRRPGFLDRLGRNFPLLLPPVTARELWNGAFERQMPLLREIATRVVVIMVRCVDGTSTVLSVLGPDEGLVDEVVTAIRGSA